MSSVPHVFEIFFPYDLDMGLFSGAELVGIRSAAKSYIVWCNLCCERTHGDPVCAKKTIFFIEFSLIDSMSAPLPKRVASRLFLIMAPSGGPSWSHVGV